MNTCHPLYDRGAGIIRYDNNNNNSLRCKYATSFWKSFNTTCSWRHNSYIINIHNALNLTLKCLSYRICNCLSLFRIVTFSTNSEDL